MKCNITIWDFRSFRSFNDLCLDNNKMEKHVNKESEVYRWTCLKKNIQTKFSNFTPS